MFSSKVGPEATSTNETIMGLKLTRGKYHKIIFFRAKVPNTNPDRGSERDAERSDCFLSIFCLSVYFGAKRSTHGTQVGEEEQTDGGRWEYSDEAVQRVAGVVVLRIDV